MQLSQAGARLVRQGLLRCFLNARLRRRLLLRTGLSGGSARGGEQTVHEFRELGVELGPERFLLGIRLIAQGVLDELGDGAGVLGERSQLGIRELVELAANFEVGTIASGRVCRAVIERWRTCCGGRVCRAVIER